MKLLLFTDTHASVTSFSSLKILSDKRISSETLDLDIKIDNFKLDIIIRSIENIIKYVKENNVDIVIFLGDVFHSLDSLDIFLFNVLKRLFSILSEAVDGRLVILSGNHDIISDNIYHNSLMAWDDIGKIVFKTEVSYLQDVNSMFVYMPFLSNQEKVLYDFRRMYKGFDARYKGIKKYLFSHNDLREFYRYNNKETRTNIDNTHISEKFTAAYFGHIHYRKKVSDNVQSIGSLIAQDFGDAWDTDRGFVVLDIDSNGIVKEEFIENKLSPLFTKISGSELLDSDKIIELRKVKDSGRNIFADILDVPLADKPRILDKFCGLFDLIRFSTPASVMESDFSLLAGDRDVGEFSDWKTMILNKLNNYLSTKNFSDEKIKDYLDTFNKYL